MENETLYYRCLMAEALVKAMVIQGITDDKKLVAAVDAAFNPQTEWEEEMYSEAIIYAKQSMLN